MSIIRLAVYFLILTLFSFSLQLKAQNINNIIISGNKRVSDETIKIYGEIDKTKQYSEKSANQILKNLYDTEFFENVEILFENNNLIINLKEYPTINQLIIVGEKSNKFKDEIRKLIKSKENKSFNKSNLSRDVNTIKNLYSSLGYNFANVETKLKKIDNE